MSRLRSSIPYEILHGIHYPVNKSSLLTYLSYFPPPPPFLPSPPPARSWTCVSRPYPTASCFVSDDRNPPSLRSYNPPTFPNENELKKNFSQISNYLSTSTNRSPKSDSFIEFFHQHFSAILLAIIFLSIFLFAIFLVVFFVYFQRFRRRTSLNNRRNNLQSRNSTQPLKTRRFYHNLIPYRRKYHKRSTTTASATTTNDENNFLAVTNHDASVLEVLNLTQGDERQRLNDDDEQDEETL